MGVWVCVGVGVCVRVCGCGWGGGAIGVYIFCLNIDIREPGGKATGNKSRIYPGVSMLSCHLVLLSFTCLLSDYAGCVRVGEGPGDGCVSQVVVQAPQVFHRVHCLSHKELPEARLTYFVEKVSTGVVLYTNNLVHYFVVNKIMLQ